MIPPEQPAEWFTCGQHSSDLPGNYFRGFLEYVGVYATRFHDLVGPLLAVEPASVGLFLSGSTTVDIGQLAADPRLRAVTGLVGALDSELFTRLMLSPHLGNLREIEISESIGIEQVRSIADPGSAFQLTYLGLVAAFCSSSREGPTLEPVEATTIIAAAPRFGLLKRLDLQGNDLGNECVEILLASTTLPRTMYLDLDVNDYDEQRYAEALAERFTGGSDEGEQ
jgi:hypothetical protein